MLLFFKSANEKFYAAKVSVMLNDVEIEILEKLFDASFIKNKSDLNVNVIGTRSEMLTPFSTSAVEITKNIGLKNIERIEEFVLDKGLSYDKLLQKRYSSLNQEIFDVDKKKEAILFIKDIEEYNNKEGLALSSKEIDYLEKLSEKIGRELSDSEIFGFSQVNSEHCRHKIFNADFIIDGEAQENSLFKLIKKTSESQGELLVSAYKDNVAFIESGEITQFSPEFFDKSSLYKEKNIDAVISLKAETHNFPTTVEPFNGAATGSGGEIRDRLAGGKGSLPLAGIAVYMTSATRQNPVLENIEERKWLYQTPLEILIKASNGASDFGNKFGQPLICGSVFCFENQENGEIQAFDKVIMLAAGVGYAKKSDAIKNTPEKGDLIIVLGGDNYRIGMGGGAVSSVNTGEFESKIELNAVQRSNPEMQKRVANTIRAFVESENNPIVSMHDHGAGGHLNCLSELVEGVGGLIHLDKLPIGDKTLSAKEIIGNESQERMGLVIKDKDLPLLIKIAERERCPLYIVGEITGDLNFCFQDKNGDKPINLKLEDFFGNSPKTIIEDKNEQKSYSNPSYQVCEIENYLEKVLSLESVCCKDFLTNKVDRSVGGKIAQQQCVGELQLPLANLGAVALDFKGKKGIAISVGHAASAALIDPLKGSHLAISEALTNIVFAPLSNGLKGVSLSANWQWACNNKGEDARLYKAVKAASDFAIALGINIPTGKDSLSMTQKYPDGTKIKAPGTLIISAVSEVSDIKKIIKPVFQPEDSKIIYLPFTQDKERLGGSSFYQIFGKVGSEAPEVEPIFFKKAFEKVQKLIKQNKVLAGHDISSGGLVTTLLEMCFPSQNIGAEVFIETDDIIKTLFCENPGVVLQVKKDADLSEIDFINLGSVKQSKELIINDLKLDIEKYRDIWFKTSYLIDKFQSGEKKALERFENYKNNPLKFSIPDLKNIDLKSNDKKPIAAIIREQGSNSEREMAHALYLAGFEVLDVHMTDLISGRENLENVSFLAAVGGFSNSDVLGSAKGWAETFRHNQKAKQALEKFFKRKDTLSIGICNGCQLFVELEILGIKSKMLHNDSNKFESAFVSLKIPENKSVMLKKLEGFILGTWIAHGEGKLYLPQGKEKSNICAEYLYDTYPSNANGSDFSAAAICSEDGRHLAMMPHPERSIFFWNWAYAPKNAEGVSPWIYAFIEAKNWILKHQ